MSPVPGTNPKKVPVIQQVWQLAQPLAQQLGLTLWDVTYQKEGADWFLRVFIDKPGGVGIDDCVDMTHALDPVLDEADPVPQEYMLEVSSPGVERRLTRPEHFMAFAGCPVRVRLTRPLPGFGREVLGLLAQPQADSFGLELDSGETLTLLKKDCSAVFTVDDGEELEDPDDPDL